MEDDVKQDDFFNQSIQSRLLPDEGMEHGWGRGDLSSAGSQFTCGVGKGRQSFDDFNSGSGCGSSSGAAMPGCGRGGWYPYSNGEQS